MSIEITTQPEAISVEIEKQDITVEVNQAPVTIELSNDTLTFERVNDVMIVADETERLAEAVDGAFIYQQDTKIFYYFKDDEFTIVSVIATASTSLDGLMSSVDKIKLDSLIYGSLANTICEGNDSRLSDARAPISHTQEASTVINDSDMSGTTIKDTLDNINEGIDIKDLTMIVRKVTSIHDGEDGIVDELNVTDFKFTKWQIHCIDQTNNTKLTTEIIAHFDGEAVQFTETVSLGLASVQFLVDLLNGKMRLIGRASANNQSVFAIRKSIKN